MLGKREPEVYGHLTLEDINQQLIAQAQNAALSLDTFQSNWEGAIVDRIHQAQQENVQFIIINPAALTASCCSTLMPFRRCYSIYRSSSIECPCSRSI